MSRLFKADMYRIMKSRLAMIALILAVALPIIVVLLYYALDVISGVAQAPMGSTFFNANTVIGSVYTFSNNIGLVIPAFAGVLVCNDYSNGTLRNKIIVGNRRSAIYLSHLATSVIFSVVIITVYALVTTGLALLFFPFNWNSSMSLGLEILYFVINGTLSFVFLATISTFFAMTMRSIAPTIIFSIIMAIALPALSSVITLVDYEKYRYAVYFIPTFAGNFFNLGNYGLLGMTGNMDAVSRETIFAEGMLSYLVFGAVNTVIGLAVFKKRDIR